MIKRRYPDMTPELYESMYEEEWRVIERYPKYEVSNYGRIRNIKTGRILQQAFNPNGYLMLTLYRGDGSVGRSVRVHRIVGEAFCENPYDCSVDELDINHDDGDKTNNHVYNLYWTTRKENIQHAFDTGLKVSGRSRRIRVVETGEEFYSARECARRIGKETDQRSISDYMRGKQSHVKGYHFEWV